MPKTQNFIFGESITVPLSAIAIEVTNIHDPFNIRARETENFREKLHIINKKLLIVHRTNLGNNVSTADPKAGNEVIICHNLSKDIDIPAWLCRGLICSADPVRKRYNILLVDYGNCIELNRADFVVSSSDLICEEHLSFTLALSNILPVCGNNNSSKEEKLVFQIIKKWSAPAIQFTKELLAVSSAVYFDCLALDDCGRKYGELYLDIEQNIIRLRDALVANGYGMYLEEELLKSLAKIMSCGKANMKIVNDETVFCAMVPRYNKAAVDETNRGTKMQSLENGGCMNDQAKNDRHKILIYGPVKCEYLFSVLDAKFPATIHKAWNSVIQSSRPTRIQSCMWPAIKKGLDVVVIGTPKSGKTIGYTMAVCGHLASHSTLPQAAKPSAVILCSSSTDVFKVYSLCTGFLESHAQIKCVAAHHGKSDRSVAAEIFNGCQILISTPKFLVRFLNQNGKLVEFTHLRYLVLDQADVILDKYLDSVGQLFEQHVIRSSDMRATDLTLQVILTARHCTPLLKKHMFVWTNNPYICIASFIEAVIFKSIRPKMYVSNLVDKNKVILEFLSNAYTKLRTMIVCASTPEAEELNEFLSVCKKTLLAHGSMNLVTLKDIKRCWQACVTGFYPVFICTDEVLSDMGVTNVEWLIHYSISLDLRTQFNFRFFTLLDNLRMVLLYRGELCLSS